jgi:hypothetical protein
VEILGYVIALAVFAATFAYFKRRPGWGPGWWRPFAIGWFLVLVAFVVYASIEHGFHPAMLLVFPILGGAFALGVALLTISARGG